MENGQQMFLPNHELKNDLRNLNLTNRLIRKCKSLGREQRKRYIELGKYCEECNADDQSEDDDNIVIKENVGPISVCIPCESEETSMPTTVPTTLPTTLPTTTVPPIELATSEKKKRAPRKTKAEKEEEKKIKEDKKKNK